MSELARKYDLLIAGYVGNHCPLNVPTAIQREIHLFYTSVTSWLVNHCVINKPKSICIQSNRIKNQLLFYRLKLYPNNDQKRPQIVIHCWRRATHTKTETHTKTKTNDDDGVYKVTGMVKVKIEDSNFYFQRLCCFIIDKHCYIPHSDAVDLLYDIMKKKDQMKIYFDFDPIHISKETETGLQRIYCYPAPKLCIDNECEGVFKFNAKQIQLLKRKRSTVVYSRIFNKIFYIKLTNTKGGKLARFVFNVIRIPLNIGEIEMSIKISLNGAGLSYEKSTFCWMSLNERSPNGYFNLFYDNIDISSEKILRSFALDFSAKVIDIFDIKNQKVPKEQWDKFDVVERYTNCGFV
eukprot:348397_1